MERKNLISALVALVRPEFNAASYEADYLTEAFAAANGDKAAFAKALAEKDVKVEAAKAEWITANAEAVAAANEKASPYLIISTLSFKIAELTKTIEAKTAKAKAAKTAEAKAAAEALAEAAKAELTPLKATAEALAEVLAFSIGATAEDKAKWFKFAEAKAKAEAEKGKFFMYWDCQNTEKSRLEVEKDVFALPTILGSAEAAANCLLSYAVFAEVELRKAKAAEAVAALLDGLTEKMVKCIEKGAKIEAVEAKLTEALAEAKAKAAAKAKAVEAEAVAKFAAVAKTAEAAEAAAKAAAEKVGKAAKKKATAEAAAASRKAEAAKTAWAVFQKFNAEAAAKAEALAAAA